MIEKYSSAFPPPLGAIKMFAYKATDNELMKMIARYMSQFAAVLYEYNVHAFISSLTPLPQHTLINMEIGATQV